MLNNLGVALGATRDSEGIGYLERALELRHEIGDRAGEAQAAEQPGRRVRAGSAGQTEALELLRPGPRLNHEVGIPLRRRRGAR